jgi:hypothetical protein
MKAAEALLLGEILMDLRGDPRLTAWEEAFVTSLYRQLEERGAKMDLSPRQHAALSQVRANTDMPEGFVETEEGYLKPIPLDNL